MSESLARRVAEPDINECGRRAAAKTVVLWYDEAALGRHTDQRQVALS